MKDNLKFITYLPFVGWLVPLWKQYENPFIINHVKQAVAAAGFFASCATLLYLVTFFLPPGLKQVKFVIVILIYVLYVFYLGIAIAGTAMIAKEKDFRIPLLNKFAEKIDI